jgi:LysM repeat protein
MSRLLMAMALAAVVLSALSASAALLTVEPGQLAVFTYPVDIEVPPCIEDCAAIESTAGDDENLGEELLTEYEIRPGDTLTDIAESTAEDGEDFGERLPASYEIRPGDTLIDIAARFGTTVEALVQLNGVQDPNLIFYGFALNVPDVGGNQATLQSAFPHNIGRASGLSSGQ